MMLPSDARIVTFWLAFCLAADPAAFIPVALPSFRTSVLLSEMPACSFKEEALLLTGVVARWPATLRVQRGIAYRILRFEGLLATGYLLTFGAAPGRVMNGIETPFFVAMRHNWQALTSVIPVWAAFLVPIVVSVSVFWFTYRLQNPQFRKKYLSVQRFDRDTAKTQLKGILFMVMAIAAFIGFGYLQMEPDTETHFYGALATFAAWSLIIFGPWGIYGIFALLTKFVIWPLISGVWYATTYWPKKIVPRSSQGSA